MRIGLDPQYRRFLWSMISSFELNLLSTEPFFLNLETGKCQSGAKSGEYGGHVSSTIMKQRKNTSGCLLNNVKYIFKFVTQLYLWSTVSKRGTQLAHSFLIPMWSFKMKPLSYLISKSSISHITIMWIISTVLCVVTSIDRHSYLWLCSHYEI